MAPGLLSSCCAGGGIGSSAVNSLVLRKVVCSTVRSHGGDGGRFSGSRHSSSSFYHRVDGRFCASNVLMMGEFSGRGGGARIIVKPCNAQRKNEASGRGIVEEEGDTLEITRFQQAGLWTAEAAYILWLFLLPYAPGDPVWAISPATVSDLLGLSLNFFFILPIMNLAGIHVLEAPVLHPMSEGLFNFVIGWTLMFAPLLFSDCRRDRFKGSLDILWGFQMFLTNTFLIPYMAIRLNAASGVDSPKEPYKLVSSLTRAAPTVAIIGGAVCLFSPLWAIFGRPDVDFGGWSERVEFLGRYLGSERLAYAFIWDIVLYSIFQPWLIGDNLENLKESSVGSVRILRFVPVLGLIAYLLSLRDDKEF